MRDTASILHLDLDAFFAAVEQRDKPSLRGKPVVVGGTGPRGVVATASYEARAYGIRSAMPTHEARARCPHAAFLNGRFDAYRDCSAVVMAVLRTRSPLVEPVSLDEAYVDLAASADPVPTDDLGLRGFAGELKAEIADATGGLRASVGIGTSKLVAKIASDLDKPDGLVIVRPGAEDALLRPMPVTVIPGIGPATNEKLRRVGVRTIADLQHLGAGELIALVGKAHGDTLARLAHARDDRAVEPDRETKSISVEDTFDVDLVDQVVLGGIVTRHARQVCDRLRAARLFGRTVTVKVRMHDFATHTRSTTLPAPTDRPRLVADLAAALLAEVDTSTGVRLLGVGVSGLTDWVQDDLFAEQEDADAPEPVPAAADGAGVPTARRGRVVWPPGADVEHRVHGPGWVWGSGLDRVTVRFETAETGPGAVRTFTVDDPDLTRRASPPGSRVAPATGGTATGLLAKAPAGTVTSVPSIDLRTIETYYDAAPRSSATTEEVGPFTLFVRTDPLSWPYYARPRLDGADMYTRADVDAVRARQRELGLPEALEWVHDVTPSLLDAARASGLAVQECPLMALDRLVAAPVVGDVEIRTLPPDESILGEVTAAVDAGFRESDEVEPPRYRPSAATVERGLLRMVGAFEGGAAIGGGSHGPRGTCTEITGIAVLPRARRRGIGAAIAAALTADATRHGVDTVFMSAQSDTVARVYARIGFVRVGTACIASVETDEAAGSGDG